MNLYESSANTQNQTQILVTGFKQVQSLENGKVNIYYNGTTVKIELDGTFIADPIVTIVPSEYSPKYQGNIYSSTYQSSTSKVYIEPNGKIRCYPPSSNERICTMLEYTIH